MSINICYFSINQFSAFHLFGEQRKLTPHLPSNRRVFLCSADKVRYHGIDGSVGQIFRHVVAFVREVERNVVAHAVELGKGNVWVVFFDVKLLHQLREPHVALLVV